MTQRVELACRAADHGAFDTAVDLCQNSSPSLLEYAACQALIASVYRQLGRHARAATFDEAGLEAQQLDPLGVAMCRIGLVADAIGTADSSVADRLRHARSALQSVPASHWATRWFDPWLTTAWVEAEICLCDDDPARAVAVLEPFAMVRPRARKNTRWPQERAKTWLFLGVAQRCAGQLQPAAGSLTRALRIAADASLRPLLVPAHQQLALLDEAQANQWLQSAQQAKQYLRRHLPEDLR